MLESKAWRMQNWSTLLTPEASAVILNRKQHPPEKLMMLHVCSSCAWPVVGECSEKQTHSPLAVALRKVIRGHGKGFCIPSGHAAKNITLDTCTTIPTIVPLSYKQNPKMFAPYLHLAGPRPTATRFPQPKMSRLSLESNKPKSNAMSTNLTDYPLEPGASGGARPSDTSINGNILSRPVPAPLAASRNPGTVQGFLNPEPTSQPPHGNRVAAINREGVGNTSAQRPSRKSRTRQPGETQWQQNKPHIEKLYMKDDLPLPEVVRRMERDHNFSASERMYKNRFKTWKWSKNLPQEKAAWMTEKGIQRRPAKTLFCWKNQEWTDEQLAQKYGTALQNLPGGSGPVACAPTPNDIQYWTISSLAPSPQQPWTAASQPHNLGNERRERDEPHRFYLDTKPVNLDINRTSISELRRLLKEASHAASAGRIESANTDFRDAVSGFRFLLSPTHDETLRAAYLYASFYANCAEMEKADAVLSWMSEKHVERWGSAHEKTYLHYARMVELLRSWGRQERAEVLVYKLLDYTDDGNFDAFINSGENHSGSEHQRSVADIDLEQSFPETQDPEVLSNQLDKIDLAIMTNITGLDNVLETIIRHCEDQPDDLRVSLQACRAKCTLAKLHGAAGRVEKTHQSLRSARRSLAPFLLVGEKPISRVTIEVARRLSFQFFEAKDEPSCNAVLDQVITALEARRFIPNWEPELDDVFLLDFVLAIAFQFHEIALWDTCRYWVERGLGLAIRLHGRKSQETRKFQKILDKEDFDMRASKNVHDLMSFSGGFFNIRVVSNPASFY
ncbi:hypothetical protein NM208_g6082 [Fusarium decemcellulare]|uniref:Uncharacterized protein n=1 Tax=Fusarium decemcellulare TaxID=57161 RepID=A0ACC1SEE1_9HYPO|nr:hypothetical protein NM208_g6082 [Fusarium decemcellulare]